MDEIEPDDIFEVAYTEPSWIHCHPDKVDAVLEIFGWSEDDVDIWQEYPAVYDGGKFYCSIRKRGRDGRL
jgi:hypothetical protein